MNQHSDIYIKDLFSRGIKIVDNDEIFAEIVSENSAAAKYKNENKRLLKIIEENNSNFWNSDL
jgi:hypothetical protein